MKACILPAALLVLTGCGGGSPSGGDKPGPTPGPAPGGPNPHVVIETSMGNITVELFADKAPLTVQNFLGYVDDKHYDGTIFHRVMGKENFERDFMIQGGGFEPGMKERPTKPPVRNESDNGLSNVRGTIAMARLGRDVGGVRAEDSATDQFYINVADNRGLDGAPRRPLGYTVFGRVTEGMDVVDKIKAVKTTTKAGHESVPVDDIVIKSIRRVEKK